MMRISLVLALCLIAGITPASAEGDSALRLYLRGAYDAAAARAVNGPWTDRTTPNYALAARSMLAKIYYLPDIENRSRKQRMHDLKQGQRYAELSVQEQPGVTEGYLHLVAALGHEGLHDGPLIVLFSGVISESKDLLEQALAIDPDNPWVHGLLGGWHLELVRNAGEGFARDNKASIEEGVIAYEKALQLAPENGMIRTEYALSLLLIDHKGFRDQAMHILAPLGSANAISQAAQIARMRGQQALGLMRREDHKGLEEFLARIGRLRAVK